MKEMEIKMKIFIDKDERMNYGINTEELGVDFNIDREKVDRWFKVMAEYDKVQDEMKKVYNAPS